MLKENDQQRKFVRKEIDPPEIYQRILGVARIDYVYLVTQAHINYYKFQYLLKPFSFAGLFSFLVKIKNKSGRRFY